MIAYDIETSQHKLDPPDVYLHGHLDIDQDNMPERLTQHCPNRCLATNGKIGLYRWDEQIWCQKNARWSIESLPELPLEQITGALRGMETPVTGQLGIEGKPTVFFTTENPSESLYALQINTKNEPDILWRVETSPQVYISAVAVAKDKVLIRTQSAHHKPVKLTTDGLQLHTVAKHDIVLSAPQPLVLTDQYGHRQLVVAEPLNSTLFTDDSTKTRYEFV